MPQARKGRLTIEDSLLPLDKTTGGQPLRYVVIGRPLVFKSGSSSIQSNVHFVLLDAKLQVLDTGIPERRDKGTLEITLRKKCSGRSHFILQLHNNDTLLLEENVRTITEHTVVQILRKEQQKYNKRAL